MAHITSWELPDQTIPRIRALVENSAPNLNNPTRLPEEDERKLSEVEQRSAACYADIEERTYRMRRFAAILSPLGKLFAETTNKKEKP